MMKWFARFLFAAFAFIGIYFALFYFYDLLVGNINNMLWIEFFVCTLFGAGFFAILADCAFKERSSTDEDLG